MISYSHRIQSQAIFSRTYSFSQASFQAIIAGTFHSAGNSLLLFNFTLAYPYYFYFLIGNSFGSGQCFYNIFLSQFKTRQANGFFNTYRSSNYFFSATIGNNFYGKGTGYYNTRILFYFTIKRRLDPVMLPQCYFFLFQNSVNRIGKKTRLSITLLSTVIVTGFVRQKNLPQNILENRNCRPVFFLTRQSP